MRFAGNRPRAAQIALGAGLVLLAGAGATMHAILRPEGKDVVPAVWAVWGLSLTVIIAGLGFAVRDMLFLRKEWQALARARSKGSAYVDHVGASPASADDHSAVARRARRIYDLRHETGAALQGVRLSLKAEAAAFLGEIGSVSRFLSGTLLLLAVVGTFAGMKSALPHLTIAIQSTNSRPPKASEAATTPEDNQEAISKALTEIANAFGANFLALIGSLCLGIAAFGATVERRALIASLEGYSERHLFPRLPAGADATAIEQLVHELRTSIGEIVAVGSGIGDLRGAIESFQHALGQSIGSMQAAFTGQFQRDLLRMQRESVTSAQELTKGVAEISKALGATTLAYQGLVEGLRERDYGLGRAAAANIAAAETLKEVNERVADQIRAATDGLATTSDRVDQLCRILVVRAQALEQAHERTVAELRASTTSMDAALGGIRAEASVLREQLRSALDLHSAELGRMADHHGALLATMKAGDAKVVSGVQRLVVSIEQGSGEAARAAREGAAGAAAAIEPAIARVQQLLQEGTGESAIQTKALATIAERISEAWNGAARGHQETLALVREALAAQEVNSREFTGLRTELGHVVRTLESRLAGLRTAAIAESAPVGVTNGDAAKPSSA